MLSALVYCGLSANELMQMKAKNIMDNIFLIGFLYSRDVDDSFYGAKLLNEHIELACIVELHNEVSAKQTIVAVDIDGAHNDFFFF